MKRSQNAWFGKRWTKSFFNWADYKMFGDAALQSPVSLASNFCITFTLGIIAGLGGCFIQFFTSAASRETAVEYVVFGCAAAAIAYFIYFLIRTLASFTTPGAKAGRIAAVLLTSLLGAALGFVIGIGLALLIITLFVLWIAKLMIFDSKETAKTITLEDGTELSVSQGITGPIYTSASGADYIREGDKFRKA